MDLIYNVGLEIEFQQLDRNEVYRNIGQYGWETVHDASTQSKLLSSLHIPVITKSRDRIFKNLSTQTFGGEAISPIMDTRQGFCNLSRVVEVLQRDVIPHSYNHRASLHIHVNVGKEPSIKNLLSIVYYSACLEATLFRIACLGQIHRGENNDYTYCRPITEKGPQIICIGNRKYAQTFDIRNLLLSKSVDEFWKKYCDSIQHFDYKYLPARYSWLNLFSIRKHGSLEYRLFNQCVNLFDIQTLIFIVQAITYKMIFNPGNIDNKLDKIKDYQDSLFNPRLSNLGLITLLDIINEFPSVENKHYYIKRIEDLYNLRDFPNIEDYYIYSHMIKKGCPTFWTGEYTPPIISKDSDIRNPANLEERDYTIDKDDVHRKFLELGE